MTIRRRQFLGATPAAFAAAATTPDFAAIRKQFPRAENEVYLDAAAHMPLPRFTADAMRRYMDFHMYGPGEGRGEWASEAIRSVRPLFARLINAKPNEIALVMCTKAGEAAVVNGLRIQESGGNLVTNDLHYAGSIHDYIGRKRAGMDVRIVKHRDWQIDYRDMERVVDKKTRLISITLVSNVNGWIEDAKRISDLAHAHGAYVYADIIQAAGSVPMDIKALGIDFAATSSYKWLYGPRGAGFLYVREDLQGKALRDLSFPGYVYFNYEPWVLSRRGGEGEFPYREHNSASRYEPGNLNMTGYAGLSEGLKHMLATGVDRIQAHTKPMCDRLKKELPAMGFRLITPADSGSSMVVVRAKNLKESLAKLKKAKVQVTSAGDDRIRVSPALYNTMGDIDRFLAALS
ncbi:MAG: aminotransferase class V-fold PLP-dependent enzyme [Acidobacteria bacterium]|nr:aminotransferase class V-fold PLP-dependent enzyme [Acidobacteriota bacterium]